MHKKSRTELSNHFAGENVGLILKKYPVLTGACQMTLVWEMGIGHSLEVLLSITSVPKPI